MTERNLVRRGRLVLVHILDILVDKEEARLGALGVPLDLRRPAVDRLSASPLVDPLEGADRKGRVRKVFRQEIVLLIRCCSPANQQLDNAPPSNRANTRSAV